MKPNICHQEHWIGEQVVGRARVLVGCPVFLMAQLGLRRMC